MLSLRMDVQLLGLVPARLRLVNQVLHAANGALVFGLGLQSGLSMPASGLAASVFFLHPVQTEAWCAGVGRADLLACLLMLFAVHLAARARAAHSSAAPYVQVALAVLLCAAATLCKETGVGAFAAVVLALLLLPSASTTAGGAARGSTTAVSRTILAGIVAAAAAAFAAWRLRVTQSQATDGTASSSSSSTLLGDFSVLDNSIALEPARVTRGLTVAHTHSLYTSLLLWPFGRLSALHGFGEVEHVRSIGDWRALAALALYAAVAVGLRKLASHAFGACDCGSSASQTGTPAAQVGAAAQRSSTSGLCTKCEQRQVAARRRLFFVIGLAAAPFALASNVPLWIAAELGERFLYLPMVGIALLAADVFMQAIGAGGPSDASAAAGAVTAAAAAATTTASPAVPSAGSSAKRAATSSPAATNTAPPATATAAAQPQPSANSLLRWLGAAAALGLLAACGIASAHRAADWRDDHALYLSALRVAPTGLKPLVNTAEALVKAAPPPPLSSHGAGSGSGTGAELVATSSRQMHPWALAKLAAEACVGVHGHIPPCWATMGTLALREKQWPRGHAVWWKPKRGGGHGHAHAGASSLLGDGVSAVRAVFSLSSTDNSQRDLEGVASQLAVPPREMLNPLKLNGDARAMQCFWAAMQASRTSGLPLPCEAAVGAAEVYLRIAGGNASGAPRIEPGRLSITPEAVALAKSSGLPEWAPAVGGPAQEEFIRNAALSVGQGEAITPVALAWSLLEQAKSVQCGVTAASVADLTTPMPPTRLVAAANEGVCGSGSYTADSSCAAAGKGDDKAGRLISANHTAIAASELLLMQARAMSLQQQPAEALLWLLVHVPSAAAPGSRLRIVYSSGCSGSASSSGPSTAGGSSTCAPALTTRRARVAGRGGADIPLPQDFAAIVDALVPSSGGAARGGMLQAVQTADAAACSAPGLAPLERLLRRTSCEVGAALERLKAAADAARSAIAAGFTGSRADAGSNAPSCMATFTGLGIREKEVALCAAMADGVPPPAEELHGLIGAAGHTTCSRLSSDAATAAAARRLVHVLGKCGERAELLAKGSSLCCAV